MWQAVRTLTIVTASIFLSACTSLFSAYDSEFSCKNSDHGGCEHPLTAYENARAESNGLPSENLTQKDTGSQAGELDSDHQHGLPQSNPSNGNYVNYQEAVYGELQGLVSEPDTPILAPAKIVRTLILPYTDPKQSSRLYMPRYVYSVLEQSKFVLGDYLVRRQGGMSLKELLTKPGTQVLVEKE